MAEEINSEFDDLLDGKIEVTEDEDHKPLKKEIGIPSPFAELEIKNKLPLILYLVSLAFLGVFAILLAINNGENDLNWTKSIYEWGQNEENASLFNIVGGWPKLIGGLLAALITLVVSLVIIIARPKKVLKYGGIFVVVAIFGFIVNQILMLLSGRPLPNVENWAEFTPYTSFAPSGSALLKASFPSLLMTIGGIMFGFPYCFNSPKTKVLEIVTAILALIYVVFMGWGLVATGQAWLSDVVFAGVIQFWFAAIVGKRVLAVREQELYDVYDRVHLPVEHAYRKILKAKSVLNYNEVPLLLNKSKDLLVNIKESGEKQKEKGKDVPFLPPTVELLDSVEENLQKIDDRSTVANQLSNMSTKVESLLSGEKPIKSFNNILNNFNEAREILEDNKAVALKLLGESIELYNAGIEAAKIEPGDFQYVVDKAEIWINYVSRFKTELEKLPSTTGDQFSDFMKANFMYII